MENTNSLMKLKEELPQLQAIMALSKKDHSNLAILAAQEIAYLETIAATKPVIKDCEPISVLLAVKTVLKQNLTLDPYAGLVYIKTRNVNVASRGAQPQWKQVLEIQPSCNGLISIARQAGRILDIKRPSIVKDEKGKTIGCSVEILLPSVPAPRWETFTFDEDDIYRWQRASHKENARGYKQGDSRPAPSNETLNWANENYFNFKGGVDPEFARAKAIRHALKKLGTNQNEMKPGSLIVEIPNTAPLIDVNADGKVIEEENKYTQHEEISSQINENPTINSSDL